MLAQTNQTNPPKSIAQIPFQLGRHSEALQSLEKIVCELESRLAAILRPACQKDQSLISEIPSIGSELVSHAGTINEFTKSAESVRNHISDIIDRIEV